MDVKNRVTDIGTRVITYIRLDQDDIRNYNGPPYSVVEHVADEDDMLSIQSLYRPSTGETIEASSDEDFDFNNAIEVNKPGVNTTSSIKGH